MKSVLAYFLIIVYSIIVFNDFKSRSVGLWCYILLLVGYITGYLLHLMSFNIDDIILNILFLTGVLSLTFIYYILRYQHQVYKRIEQSIGWGDVLLIPFILVSFSFGNFVSVFLLSLISSLTWFLIIGGGHKHKTIPLAGIQSAIIVVAIVLDLLGVLSMNVDVIKFL